MNPLTQSRRCEECGVFFTVSLVRDVRSEGTPATRVRVFGPWACDDCRKHPVRQRNPVGRQGDFLGLRLDGKVSSKKVS